VVVVLSEGERQVLAHLEADLCREDPFLAVALLRMCPPQPGRWVRIAYDTVVTLALIETLVCLALLQNGTGAACLLAAALAAATRVLRVRQFPRQSRGARTHPPVR
jgi:hypothetical protein